MATMLHAMPLPPKVSTRLYSFTLSPSSHTCKHATELLRTCRMMGHIMFPLRQYSMPSIMPMAVAKNTCAGFMCIRPKSTALTRMAVGALLLHLSMCPMMPQRNIISSPKGAPMAIASTPHGSRHISIICSSKILGRASSSLSKSSAMAPRMHPPMAIRLRFHGVEDGSWLLLA